MVWIHIDYWYLRFTVEKKKYIQYILREILQDNVLMWTVYIVDPASVVKYFKKKKLRLKTRREQKKNRKRWCPEIDNVSVSRRNNEIENNIYIYITHPTGGTRVCFSICVYFFPLSFSTKNIFIPYRFHSSS